MESLDIRIWATETMRLTRKMPTTRASFNSSLFKADHPDIDFSPYEKVSQVAGSLVITVQAGENLSGTILPKRGNRTRYGFLPHHTSVGVGKTGKDHWRVEKYRGKFGKGFKMLTTSPFSTNFNHVTYFTIA